MSRNPRTRLLLLLIIAGCTPVLLHQLDQRFGIPDSHRYAQAKAPVKQAPEYWHDVRPLLEQRCVVCHGCYDAPCQQNLTSWDGIARGANSELVYSSRLKAVDPLRLFIDAQSPDEWRAKNFHPVLNERADIREANLQGSVLYRLLDLKRQQPLPQQPVLDSDVFTFALNRKQTCPKIEAMEAFEQDHPLWGMPYGLPALSATEFATMEEWLAAGAPVASKPELPEAIVQQVNHWEAFLNGGSNKQHLMSRYLYEHLFLAHLYFDGTAEGKTGARQFFRLVRSSTPPGTPVKEIATRRPYDDPGMTGFWYRLRLDEGSVVEKTHMPYALNNQREAKWHQWFLADNIQVDSLPGYAPEVAGNPFIAFRSLPVDTRYRFLLDEAQFAVETFIKGPVCRGQVALGVIDDHFWVFFVDPDALPAGETAEFLASQSGHLRLPGEEADSARVIDWLKYSRLQKDYLKAKQQKMEVLATSASGFTEAMMWRGNDQNKSNQNNSDQNSNAALTIFRHSDSATVVKGLVGQPPKTAWVLSYSLLERIYYLLVAGYDVYGGVGHQLNTRLYMDFMRMEGEANFLAFLPRASRAAIRDYWYRNASEDVKDYIYGKHFNPDIETGIHYHTDNPQLELYGLLSRRLGKHIAQDYDLARITSQPLREAVQSLQSVRGKGLAAFPQNSILRVDMLSGEQRYFTLLNNSGYSNNSELLGDDKRRLPDEDYLTVVPGFLGAYPNAFFRVPVASLPAFVQSVQSLKDEAGFTALADRFAIRRTSQDFWPFSDALQQAYWQQQPVTSGILDYNRFENR